MLPSAPEPPRSVPARWAVEHADSAPAELPSWLVASARFASSRRFPDEPATEPPAASSAAATPAMVPTVAQPTVAEPARPARDWEREVSELQEQLAATIATMVSLRRQVLEASERDLVQLAIAIAEKVIGRELGTDPALVAGWAEEALAALVDQDELEVVVSADVARAVPEERWRDSSGKPIAPRIDPKLPPGSCEVRGSFSRVEAGAAARVQALADALGAQED